MVGDDAGSSDAWHFRAIDRTLQRLAVALGTSPEALSELSQSSSLALIAAQEAGALLQAFDSITDRETHRRGLTYVLEAVAMASKARACAGR